MDNRIRVVVNAKHSMYISPIELQIAFKLWLGSDKDYEDARYIYNVFKAHIDAEKLREFITELHIKKEIVKKVIGEFDETK